MLVNQILEHAFEITLKMPTIKGDQGVAQTSSVPITVMVSPGKFSFANCSCNDGSCAHARTASPSFWMPSRIAQIKRCSTATPFPNH